MSERISETITFHFDNVEQQKRFHERLEVLTPSEPGSSAALRAQVSPDAESCYCPNCNILPPERERFRAQVIEECAKVAEQVERDFLSPEYATNQPISSISERFACQRVADAIRSLSAVSAIAPPEVS